MTDLARGPLGSSGIKVSELALGSWRTYERIPRERGIAVMTKAREVGINFLDDARYNDETGNRSVRGDQTRTDHREPEVGGAAENNGRGLATKLLAIGVRQDTT